MMNNTPQRTVTEWAQRIWMASTKTAEAIIALGQELLEAKTDLGHGHFGRLFLEHEYAIANPVPFSQSTAERYMRIAATLGPYSAHVQNMPTSVRALMRLVRLPAHQRHGAIVGGLVHPDSHEREVVALGQSQAPWSLDAAEERIRKAINLEIINATLTSADDVIALLRRLADELERRTRPEITEAVANARRDLAIHDSERGGYRVFEDDREAATHPGAPAVVFASKSTHANWYKELTRGRSAFRRRQIDHALDLAESGQLPTRRTERAYFATVWALGVCP